MDCGIQSVFYVLANFKWSFCTDALAMVISAGVLGESIEKKMLGPK